MQNLQESPEFPENNLHGYTFLFEQMVDELLDIKVTESYVLSYNGAVNIYEDFCFLADHSFLIAWPKKLVTICAKVNWVVFSVKKFFNFLLI